MFGTDDRAVFAQCDLVFHVVYADLALCSRRIATSQQWHLICREVDVGERVGGLSQRAQHHAQSARLLYKIAYALLMRRKTLGGFAKRNTVFEGKGR